MKEIKAVLFDLGGVLIDVDYQKTIDAFTNLGVQNASDLYNQFDQSKLFDAFETGDVSSDYFIEQLKPLVSPDVRTIQIVDAWNAMIGSFPIKKLDFVKEIAKQTPCFLLSNTNEIHIEKAMNSLKETPYAELDNLFKECYYSHLIGMRKPNVSTFKWVLNQMGVNADETLFIDDSPQHIEGAKKTDLQTIYYREPEDLWSIRSAI